MHVPKSKVFEGLNYPLARESTLPYSCPFFDLVRAIAQGHPPLAGFRYCLAD